MIFLLLTGEEFKTQEKKNYLKSKGISKQLGTSIIVSSFKTEKGGSQKVYGKTFWENSS